MELTFMMDMFIYVFLYVIMVEKLSFCDRRKHDW